MPCIMKYPAKIKGGQLSSDLLLNIDFAPTLLEYAGVEIPADIQGESFAPIIEGDKDATSREEIYYHYYEYPFWHNVQPHYGIRTNRYKLIHFYYDVDIWELYDMESDPNEVNNLYGNSDYDAIVADLKERLKGLQDRYEMDKSYEELRDMTDAKIERRYVKEPAN